MKEYKILNTIGPKFSEKAKDTLNIIGDVDYITPTQDELSKIIDKYYVVVCGLGLSFTKSILEKSKNLKVIVTATTGLDHIDLYTANERNIKIISLREETDFLNSITGTAELAFGLILDLLRLTPFAFNDVKNGNWNREAFRGHNLSGLTLGVVGAGRLGKKLIKYGNAFDMKAIFYDPNVKNIKDAEKVNFDKLIKDSDIISIHVHLNEETKNMFNKEVFNNMKNGAYLVNTSRGKIVNEEDILSALKDKNISGYATDVLNNELCFKDSKVSGNKLVEYSKNNKNVVITPHIGGMTYESRQATDIFIANKLKKYLESI